MAPSVGLLCHPWFTTTNLSYRCPIVKLPPPPCVVLLVKARYDVLYSLYLSWAGRVGDGLQLAQNQPWPKSNLELANLVLFLIWISLGKIFFPANWFVKVEDWTTPKNTSNSVMQLVSYAAQMLGDHVVRLDEASHCFNRGAPTPWLRLPAETGDLVWVNLIPHFLPPAV